MKCRLSCCGGWWCIFDLPTRALVRCTAKSFILAFSALIFALALLTIALGVVALETHSFVHRIIPDTTAFFILGTGGTMILTALSGFIIAACVVHHRRCSRFLLFLLMLLTCAAFTLALLASASALTHSQLIETGFGFGDVQWVEDSFYESVKQAFVAGWEDCPLSAYLTTSVNTACNRVQPSAECAHMPKGWLGLFCMPRNGSFDVNSSFAFPDPGQDLLAQTHDYPTAAMEFSWWINWACMPNATEAARLLGDAQLTQLANSWSLPSAASKAEMANSTFARCMSSTWRDPTSTAELKSLSDSHLNLQISPEESNLLQLLESHRLVGMNAKMAFCFCAARGSESALFQTMSREASLAKGSVIFSLVFVLLTLMSECYLCFCLRRPPPSNSEEREVLFSKGDARLGDLTAWPGTSVRAPDGL